MHIIVDEEISDVGMDEDSDDDMGPTPTPQDLRSRYMLHIISIDCRTVSCEA